MNLGFDGKHKMKLIISFVLTIGLGIFFRFYQINRNIFFFYDEGMWLNIGREILDFYYNHTSRTPADTFMALKLMAKVSLSTAKSLWAFLAMLRGIVLGPEALYFTRIISAISGTLTIFMIFLLARVFYKSNTVALISAWILALSPAHIFYSRLGLQEALSTFLFVSAVYLYLTSRKLDYKVFLSGVILALVFFSNYRMIICPLLILFLEGYLCLAEKRMFDVRKYAWNTLTFLAVVFIVGSLYGGANTKITFAWMYHQKQLAENQGTPVSFLSYPYYLFKLNGIVVGILFLGNIYLAFKRKWREILPFALVLFLMAIFSLPQEKDARYLCVGMPFVSLAAGYLICYFGEKFPEAKKAAIFLMVSAGLILATNLLSAINIINFRNDYESAIDFIKKNDPTAKICSTQFEVQRLYVADKTDVIEAPNSIGGLLFLFSKGYRYLIIDPQAYISFGKTNQHFDDHLIPYLEFAKSQVPPIKVYPHFSRSFFEWFALEHNENLPRTINFLNKRSTKEDLALYIFDIKACILKMYQFSQMRMH